MKEISKEVKSLSEKKGSQLCSWSWTKQIKHRNEWAGDLFFIPLTYGEKINLKKKQPWGNSMASLLQSAYALVANIIDDQDEMDHCQ